MTILLHHPWEGWPVGRQNHASTGRKGFSEKSALVRFVMEDLPHPLFLSAKSKIFLLAMEPVEMKDSYHPAFLSQFDGAISWRRHLPHPHLQSRWVPYPWFYGVKLNAEKKIPDRWTRLCEIENEPELFALPRPVPCSFLLSSKNICENHARRIRLMEFLRARLPNLQVCGYDQPFEDKRDILSSSQTSVIIENHDEPDGFTEKIQDCFLAGAHPFYWGCRNLESYFPAESFTRIPLENPARCLEIIRNGIQKEVWKENLAARQEARRLVIEKYNIYPALRQLGQELAYGQPSEKTSLRWVWPEWFFRDRSWRWFPRIGRSLFRKWRARIGAETSTTLDIP